MQSQSETLPMNQIGTMRLWTERGLIVAGRILDSII